MPVESKRSDRRRQVDPFKKMIEVLPEALPIFYQVEQLRGSNESTQYVGVLGHQSLLYHQMETIKIEVGLREPLLQPATKQKTRTILLDPISKPAGGLLCAFDIARHLCYSLSILLISLFFFP